MTAVKLPAPWRITFDTNPDTCNLRCIMCEVFSIFNPNYPPKHRRIMDRYIIKNVVSEVHDKGLREIIPSTMGEPLLYPYFDTFIEVAKKYGIKINLTTNGTFPINGGVSRWGEPILSVASDVKISINGAKRETAESIMVGLDFKRQLKNIEKFLEIRDEIRRNGINNPTVTFQVTFMERNIDELPDLLKLAIDLGVDRFKGHHLWITWPQLKKEHLLRDARSIRRWNEMVDKLRKIQRTYGQKKIKLANIYKVDIDTRKNSYLPEHWICPFVGREAWIAWDGTFNVCCAPDKQRRVFGYFGNVLDKGFLSLWNSQKYSMFVKKWGSYEPCRKCNMRRPPEEVIGK